MKICRKTIAFVMSALPARPVSMPCRKSTAVPGPLFPYKSSLRAGLSRLISCLTSCWWARFTFKFMIWRSGNERGHGGEDQSPANWLSPSRKATASGAPPPRGRWPLTSDVIEGHRWRAGIFWGVTLINIIVCCHLHFYGRQMQIFLFSY